MASLRFIHYAALLHYRTRCSIARSANKHQLGILLHMQSRPLVRRHRRTQIASLSTRFQQCETHLRADHASIEPRLQTSTANLALAKKCSYRTFAGAASAQHAAKMVLQVGVGWLRPRKRPNCQTMKPFRDNFETGPFYKCRCWAQGPISSGGLSILAFVAHGTPLCI
jgi:hypothetical protein